MNRFALGNTSKKGIRFMMITTLLTMMSTSMTFTACPEPLPLDRHTVDTSDKGGHGGEQGLEPGEVQLSQDYDAAYGAINGWWKDSQAGLKDRMSWYNEAMFGCFIHWGPYSDLESKWNGKSYNGYAEHIMRMAKIPVKTYKDQVVKNFNPAGFDADEWMRQARDAGMKYFVITAKHHDGFAM